MRKSVTIISLLLVTVVLSAKQVDVHTAGRVAASFASTMSPLRSAQDVKLVYMGGTVDGTLRADASPLFYVYNIGEDNGFVMVSGDDQALPILAYADKGAFYADDMPANLKNWLAFYEKEITYSIANGWKASAETSEAWRKLLSGTLRRATVHQLRETALWDQDFPYNNLCPEFQYFGRTYQAYTGCVATTMAIIMKYHEWPKRGTGTIEYTSESFGKKIELTLGDDYNWGNMVDKYVYLNGVQNWTDEQEYAVSKLMYHCAVVAQSDFTIEWTGAYPHLAMAGMIENFNYDVGAYMVYRSLYTDEEWHALMQKELDEGRPIFYGGMEMLGDGHQFVLDGYNSDNYFHVNWGWSGWGNGFYLLSCLDAQDDGIGKNDPETGFFHEQSAGIGLQKPQEGSLPRYEFLFFKHKDVDFIGLQTTTDSIRADEEFHLKISPFSDYGSRDFDGYVGLFLVDTLGNIKELLETKDTLRVSVEGGMGLADLEGDTYTIHSTIEKGDKIRMLFSVDSVNWTKVRGVPGAIIELPVYKSGTVGNENAERLSAVELLSTTFDSEVTIRVKEPVRLQQALFYDLGGRLVKQFRLRPDDVQVTLSVGDMQPGIYILSVRTAEGNRQFKVRKR